MWKTLSAIYHDNAAEQLLVALGVTLVLYLVLTGVRGILAGRLQAWADRTSRRWDDIFATLVRATHGVSIFAISLLIGLRSLDMPDNAGTLVERAMVLVLLLQVGRWGSAAVAAWLDHRLTHGEASQDGKTVMNLGIVAFGLRLLLWVVLVLMILDNLGVNITALVASLGIGGVAVALAVQNILGDLFASLSIALDKPFVVGDFIIVDDMMGTVKHIGMKTTRIQSLFGEELIFSNADLLKSRIRNYKAMQQRRVVFNFSVAFSTPVDKLRRITEAVREAINQHGDRVRVDRVHFQAIGSGGLAFEVVYYVMSGDYNQYMDIQQDINFSIIERFAAEHIEFAFPTQTLHIASVASSDDEEGYGVRGPGRTELPRGRKPN
ncbi:mechanosensitive ion channel family protein [Uliginosibacterium sp. sgz301328]|uniref:mechanosensitive ion channel family protein n=1 Tax=Uliginosibacterium sp. sgz301328 TaxID=3243764 RepID=UPI00359DB233